MYRNLSSEHAHDGTVIIKIVSIFVIFTIALVFGNIPIYWKNFRGNQLLYATVNAFSAGILLSFGIIHLLPEVNEKISEQLGGHEGGHQFPWAFLITILTYLLILMIERVVFDHHHAHGHGYSHEQQNILNKNEIVQSDHVHTDKCRDIEIVNPTEQLNLNISNIQDENVNEDDTSNKIILNNFNERCLNISHIQKKSQQRTNNISKEFDIPYVLIMAFCFHDVIEGIALGLQKEQTDALNLLIAICLHKWAQYLSLGANFNHNNKFGSFKIILLMAFLQPIGIGIGWAIQHASELVSNIFLAMTVGIFLYISTSEIIPDVFSSRENKWYKFFALCSGVAIIVGQWFYESDSVHASH